MCCGNGQNKCLHSKETAGGQQICSFQELIPENQISFTAGKPFSCVWFLRSMESNQIWLKRDLSSLLRGGKNRTNLFPKGQWYFILVALNLKGRRGRRIEAKRKAAPVPHLHSHLCPCTFISWWREREKLEGSFFCYFPVEEGSVLPIPFRIQPAK